MPGKHIVLAALVLFLGAGSAAAPPQATDLVSVLEAQGELEMAWAWQQRAAVGAADSTLANLQRTLRLLVRRRDYAAAWDILQREGKRLEPGTRAVLAAAVALRLDQPSAALAHLEAATVPAGLAGFAEMQRADACQRLGRWEEARRAALAANAMPLPQEMQRRLRLIEGQACFALGDIERLRLLAPRLGEDARSDDRTGLLLLQLAREVWRGGDTEQGRRWLLDLLAARPAPAESAYAALQVAIARGASPPDVETELLLARYEDRSQRAAQARQRLQALAASGRLTALQEGEAWVAVAESWRRQGRANDCLAVLSAHAERIRGTPSEPEMLRCRGRACRALGDEAGIMASYSELARRFPSDPNADAALYEVGWRQEIGNDYAAAMRTYATVEQQFPQSSLGDDAAFREALCALRSGNLTSAQELFGAMETQHPGSPLVPRSLYWRSWILERRGDVEAARVLRARLQRDHRDSYYAVLAARADSALDAAPTDTAPSWRDAAGSTESPQQIDGLELAGRNHARYLAAIESLHRTGVPAASASFEAEATLWHFCLDYGLANEASWETRRLEQRFAVDPGALLELLATTYVRGVHDRLVRLSFMLSLLVQRPESAAAIEVLRHPAPLSVTLAAATREHGVSHAVVLGVIRQESAFDPRADSRAGARGLMQIMPAVGVRLASQRGEGNLPPERLYATDLNLELGCQLFAEELRRAQGSLPQALAAYNAGSDPAEKWRRRLQPEEPPELYLDVAEYLETRNYLDRVLGGAETYRRVYDLP
ncbi:MAG TPA: transglycosylase SLT domain-containing protein [Candidatus Krumholzibacteria bacterium]|nr:transglycosylase SLT domain-containing protein [Candidatus Krumholzibacteria bacterium]